MGEPCGRCGVLEQRIAELERVLQDALDRLAARSREAQGQRARAERAEAQRDRLAEALRRIADCEPGKHEVHRFNVWAQGMAREALADLEGK